MSSFGYNYSGPPPQNDTTYPLWGSKMGNIIPWQSAGPAVQQQTPYGQQMQMFNGMLGGLMGQGGQAVGAANQYAGMANAYAGQLAGIGQGMQNEFAYNDQYAQQALKDAFDPNQDAYKQAVADLTDSTRSGEAARGIAMTPYGSSIESQTLGRFANDWRTQQIQREQMGSQSAGALQGARISAQLGGAGLIGQAGQLDLGAAQAMLQAYGLQGENMRAALAELVAMMNSEHISTHVSGSS